MANDALPLLLFPQATTAEKNRRFGGDVPLRFPPAARQGIRIAPKLKLLQGAFESKRLKLQQSAPNESPELVIVFETIGSVENFAKAVSKIPGLDWLLESDEEEIAPDEDFFVREDPKKDLSGRVYLVGSNLDALNQLVSLWQRYVQNPDLPFPRGLGPWRHVFKQLRDLRYWSVADRVGDDVRAYWTSEIESGQPSVRFEIDVWYFNSQDRNEKSYVEVRGLLQGLQGRVVQRLVLPEIEYHGVLAELPASAIQEILDGVVPELLASDRVMYFRPRTQSIASMQEASVLVPQAAPAATTDEPPLVALFDGLPQQNHPLLAGRLTLDDPDGWEAEYEVKDRVHGTAMASLILHGELDSVSPPLRRKLYVRPLLRPQLGDVFNQRRAERTPDDVLLIDLVHRAVRRMFEVEGGSQPAAPTVRIVNLSLGSESHLFDKSLSPWARLIDWLSFKYRVLFVVSAGNYGERLTISTPSGTIAGRGADEQQELSVSAVLGRPNERRLLSPAESINSISVGSTHSDSSNPPVVPGRFDLFAPDGISPISRIGHGFKRAVKPDILMPGGRILFLEQPGGDPAVTVVGPISAFAAPGHRVAIPPMPGDAPNVTAYCRGTSNAAALASRHAARLFDVIESLRASAPDQLPARFDGALLKAMLAHGASWGSCPTALLTARPDLITTTQKQEFLARWLGYGPVDTDRAIACTSSRATLIGAGELVDDSALVFSAPLPPTLAGKKVLRRLTVTLAWFSPTNASHRSYRRAKLWISPPDEELRVGRDMTAFYRATQRGTLQHEVLEGEQAISFSDGDQLEFKVNCAKDAGDLVDSVVFGLCVSLEVPIAAGIPIYQEIRDRIAPAVTIKAG